MQTYPLKHKLGDPIALLDLEADVAEIEEQDLERAAIVGVDDASANIDAVFRGEAGAGCDAAVCCVYVNVV